MPKENAVSDGEQLKRKRFKRKEIAQFQVSLKLLLRNNGKILVLRTNKGYVDFPGGRIDKGEEMEDMSTVVAREIREELGNVKYRIGRPLFHYRGRTRKGGHVFVLVHEAQYVSGQVRISHEHRSHEWVDAFSFKVKETDFDIKEKYLLFQRFLKSIRGPLRKEF